jgi:outer membrane protein OmpA-like peptidoglycan-associated protein
MTLHPKTALVLTLGVALVLTACKPKPGEPTAEQQAAAAAAAAPAAAAPAPAAVVAPAAAPVPAAASSAAIADLSKIAVIAKPLPPFPYIDYPASVHEAHRDTKESDFDQAGVIVGDKLHMVEGKVKLSEFDLKHANISEFQAKRDYAKAALDMGGVKVNNVGPHDDAFYAANGMGERSDAVDKQRYDTSKVTRYAGGSDSYDVYFFPTATGRSWLVLMINESEVRILAIEEKTAASSVKLISSAAIKSELDTKGRIALYINFDTDKASIRPDGKPAVDEIASLMKKEAALKLSVEGHTDNVGEAARNASLSRERAQAVVDALVKDGIESARLSAAGHGAGKPLAGNGSEEGRARNRRVELVKVVKG